MRQVLRIDVEFLTDEIISQVNHKFPDDQDARLVMYDTLADKLLGLVRALRGEIRPGTVQIDRDPADDEDDE